MKIPKKIQTLLNRRERLALQLNNICRQLDAWLEKNGADLTDADLCDSTLTGCLIYCEPYNAKASVMDYIENKM